MNKEKKKGVAKMAAVKVKPIQPTIISDLDIIKDVIREATTVPSLTAMKLNKEASDLLSHLRRNTMKR